MRHAVPIATAIAVIMAASVSGARAPVSVRVQPEQPTTLHVGDIAALQLPGPKYTIIGSAGSSLLPLKPQGRSAVRRYRAARTGNMTLLFFPKGRRDGDCISCVTVHYFVNVVP